MPFDTLEQMVVATAASVQPPERLTVSQAGVKYRWIDNPGSYIGRKDYSLTPYMVEPADELQSTEFTGLAFAGPARTGKTDMWFDWACYTVKCDPADMIVYQMTLAAARDWSMGDLGKALNAKAPGEDVGHLAAMVAKRNVHDVRFSHGMTIEVKWPSLTEMSGKTKQRVFIFDFDRLPQSIEAQGNPFDLAHKRRETFREYGMCGAEGSPGFNVIDPKKLLHGHEAPPTKGILEIFNRGDRRLWFWRCPQCSEAFEPSFKLLAWPKSTDRMESAEQAYLVCPHNGCIITHDMKKALNLAGRWIKEGQVWLPDGTITGKARRSNIASFWLKGPAAGFQTWKGLVLNFLTAQEAFENTGDEEPLKATINLDQGEPYTPKALLSDRDPSGLRERAEDWGGSAEEPVVPEGVRFIIATADVQARAFVCQAHGVCDNGDICFIDTWKIRKSERLDQDGHPYQIDPAGHPEDWDLLIDGLINRSWPLADGSGRRMAVKFSASDSGGREGVASNAYNFWRRLTGTGHQSRFVLVKGEPSTSAPRTKIGYPDSQRKDRHAGARGDVPVLFLNSTLLKDMASNLLARAEVGGQVRFPRWLESFIYTQLTAEVRTTKGIWENPRGRRNEAWDCFYYCLGVLVSPYISWEHIDWSRPPRWAETWDLNEMVFGEGDNSPVEFQLKPEYDLESLAKDLA